MKYKIKYLNNYPGSPNPDEIKEEVIETNETKERLLQHAHIIEVKEDVKEVVEKVTKILPKKGRR